jgi:hypothetical protein
LLLFNTVIAFGNTFDIAGYSMDDRYNIQFDWYVNNYLSFYADYYKLYDAGTYSTTIIGTKYFFNYRKDHRGFYIGAGVPLFKNLSYDSDANTKYKITRDVLKEAYDRDYDLRVGYRIRINSDLKYFPWIDFGYSNIKSAYCNVGLSF